MKKFKNFYKKHKGYILSSLAVILIYPLGHIIQFKHIIPIDKFLLSIPVSLALIFVISLPFRVLSIEKEKSWRID